MSLSINEREEIRRAHQIAGPPFVLPWSCFEEFFQARVSDPASADRVFLSYHDDDQGQTRRYTYAEFGQRVREVAAFLRQRLGLQRGDRLATVLFNHDQTVILYFAAWTIGVAVIPINIEESDETKRYILEHSEAVVAVGWEQYADAIRQLQSGIPKLREVIRWGEKDLPAEARISNQAPPAPSPTRLDDVALIVYTSGTTGPPKGVILTAENLLIDADGIAQWHSFGSDDRLMCVLPIHHVNGTIVTLVTPFYFGGSTVLNRKFKTTGFWRRLHEEQVTCVSVVPTLLEFLLEANENLEPYHLDRFKGVICGAGPLLKETAARFESRFRFPIHHGYGLSETTCYSCFLPNDLPSERHRHWLIDYEFPSIGVPIRHNDMAILDDHGRPVAEGARGEICIRGRTVCAGYFKRPDANETAFRGGWFRSGDEGFYMRDENGRPFFFISGRLKELIIRGGVNISPLEIDDVLKGHPAVKFAMAVPFENRYYGEEIAAYVVPREGVETTDAAILEYCRTRLVFSKRPKVIVFGQDVPYTATGKPKRLALKASLAASLASYRDVQFKES
jgi:acyl-CoA synthetase (AMP-forming)/AMP-acid ligase II